MQDFPIWQRLLTFSALLVFQKHARQQHCCDQKFSVGEGDFLHQFKSSSGIVRRIENLTKLLKIPHSQKARGLSRAGMILMVGIGQYWLIYIETKFSEWLLVWQWWWINGASNLLASRSLLSLVAVSSDLITRSDHHGRNERTPPSSFSTSSQGLTSLSKFAGFVLGAGLENKDAYFLRFYSCLFEILPLSISSLLSKGSLN